MFRLGKLEILSRSEKLQKFVEQSLSVKVDQIRSEERAAFDTKIEQIKIEEKTAFESQLETKVKEKIQIEQRAYEAAQVTQIYNDWLTVIKPGNADIFTAQKKLVARGRDAAQNDPYAKKFLRNFSKNVVGPNGFTYRSKSFDWKKIENNEWAKVYDQIANQKIQNGWAEWNKKQFCTASKRFSFNNFTRIALQTVVRDGEVFIIKQPLPENENKFGFTLKLFETEYVDINLNRDLGNGRFIFMGVELDGDLKRHAYYFKKFRHQDQLYGVPSSLDNYDRVDAQFVNHLFYAESYFQIRGITWFAPGLVRMHMLNAYEEAILMKARINACAPFVLEPKDNQVKNPTFGITGGAKDTSGNIVKGIEVGEPWISPKGYETKFPDTKTPSGQEAPFTRLILSDIAASVDMSYMTFSGDYIGANFTVSRTALNDDRDGWRMIHDWVISDYCEDIYPDWLRMALLYQAIKLPLVLFDKFNQPWFIGRSWQYVQPKEDAETDEFMISHNLDTYENRLGMRGLDYEDVMDRRQFEVEDMKKRGIYVESKGAQKNNSSPDDNSNPLDNSKPKDNSEDDSTVPQNGKAKKLITTN